MPNTFKNMWKTSNLKFIFPKAIVWTTVVDIPDAAIERIARVMLPMIQKYYESDEGKMELEKWKQEKGEQENE